MKPTKAIFLERDGTLIEDQHYLNDPEQISYLPGVVQGLRQLRDVGFLLIVVTNQSGLARGLVRIQKLHEIHRCIRDFFARHGVDIKAFYWAPYLPESNHFCRKPNPGMLFQAAKDFQIDLRQSWMIGDQITDWQAGNQAGCRSLLLEGPRLRSLPETTQVPPLVVRDLRQAAQIILSHQTF